MAVCKKTRRIRKIICAASFNRTIDILTRDQLAAVNGTADPTIDLPVFATVLALVHNVKPVEIFNGTNVSLLETHIFKIRYNATIESLSKTNVRDHTINLNGKFFRLERIQNDEEENRYLSLFATERGDDTIVGNRA